MSRSQSASAILAVRLVRMPNGCLEWTGATSCGYGNIRIKGKTVKTHRLVWELVNGPIPDGLHVLHHCDNRPCCQTKPTEGFPEGHLFLGTPADNAADRVAKGRNGINAQAAKTHCRQGHLYDEANTHWYRGRRDCRACNRAAVARQTAKRRAA
jgi:hypothetical protein